MFVQNLIMANRNILALMLGLSLVIFMVVFFATGMSAEEPEANRHSTTEEGVPELSANREELLSTLMQYGHWEVELAEATLGDDVTLENLHEYLKLVGIYTLNEEKQALFIVDAVSDWRSKPGLDDVNVTPDGRIRVRLEGKLAPHIELKAINKSSVDLLVNGEPYTKQLYPSG